MCTFKVNGETVVEAQCGPGACVISAPCKPKTCLHNNQEVHLRATEMELSQPNQLNPSAVCQEIYMAFPSSPWCPWHNTERVLCRRGESCSGLGSLRSAGAALGSARELSRSGQRGVGLTAVSLCGSKAFPNYLQGSKYGGCCMNELELDNIMCVEPFSFLEKCCLNT